MLAELDWTGAELARRVDVHPNTVSHWLQGHAKGGVPGAVMAYLRLYLRVRRLLD
jgi:transcriptional regulator with XRE-family HTH domain